MTTTLKTCEEINAEKAAKSRPDLLPALPLLQLSDWDVPSAEHADISGLHTDAVHVRATNGSVAAFSELIGLLIYIVGDGSYGTALLRAGQVMGYGYRKHGKCTWRVAGTEQADPQTHIASGERHILEWKADPDAVEEGSGLPVLWHALSQYLIAWDLLLDPPQHPGQNDGHGMIGDRL